MVDLSNMKQMYILCGYESFAFKLLAALVLFVKVRSNIIMRLFVKQQESVMKR